ncbi:MAG: hypothetical protein P1U56_12115, partial [Saprospiraceae bacterium]|nr:hypothetical protein [Saprospiraceae bacterium]
MSKERINNQFQNTLEQYASDIDSDQLWSAIEGRVPRKKRKRRFIFWLFLGIPLLGILLWGNTTNFSLTESSIAPNQEVNRTVLQNEVSTIQNDQLSESSIKTASLEREVQLLRLEEKHKTLKKVRLHNRTPTILSSPIDSNDSIEEMNKPSSIQNSEVGHLPIKNRIYSPLKILKLKSLQI